MSFQMVKVNISFNRGIMVGRVKVWEGLQLLSNISNGILCHRALECTALICFKCGKERHRATDCKRDGVVCFHCRESGHIST